MTADEFSEYCERLNAEIGLAIRRAREAKQANYYQVDLATAVNLNRGYVSQLEGGKRNTTINTLAAVCNELGISMAALIAEAEIRAQKTKSRP